MKESDRLALVKEHEQVMQAYRDSLSEADRRFHQALSLGLIRGYAESVRSKLIRQAELKLWADRYAIYHTETP